MWCEDARRYMVTAFYDHRLKCANTLNIASYPSLGKERSCQLDSRHFVPEAHIGVSPRVIVMWMYVELHVSKSVSLYLERFSMALCLLERKTFLAFQHQHLLYATKEAVHTT
jgi:hypothetical protein